MSADVCVPGPGHSRMITRLSQANLLAAETAVLLAVNCSSDKLARPAAGSTVHFSGCNINRIQLCSKVLAAGEKVRKLHAVYSNRYLVVPFHSGL